RRAWRRVVAGSTRAERFLPLFLRGMSMGSGPWMGGPAGWAAGGAAVARWAMAVAAAEARRVGVKDRRVARCGGGMMVLGGWGCAGKQMASGEPPEAGEVKVKLAETPAAVRGTIEKELVGAELEDIARKERQGQTVYETDIIRDGHKWEVIVGEDGRVIS